MPRSRSRSRSQKRKRSRSRSRKRSRTPPRTRAKRDDSREKPNRRSRWGSDSSGASSGEGRSKDVKEQLRKAKEQAEDRAKNGRDKKKKRRKKNWEDSQSETESSSSDSEPVKTEAQLRAEAERKAKELLKKKKPSMKLIFNYYEVMDLPDFSSAKAAKKAYRLKAQMYHPDKNLKHQEQAERRMHRVTESYECLKDPDRKKSYDGRLLCELKRKAKYDRRYNRFGIDLPPSPPPPDFEYWNWDPTMTRKRRKAKPASPLGSPCSAEEKMRDLPRTRKRKKRRFQVVPQNANYNESFNFARVMAQRMKGRRGNPGTLKGDLDFMD